MRRSNFGSVWKHHYTRLPEMPANVLPLPYADVSKEAIGVFLIFDRFDDVPSTGIEDWVVKSACWARRSWLHNTDAVELGIPLKFYVQESIKDRVRPLLAEYGIGGKDIIYFDASDFYETRSLHFDGAGAKQCAIYSDAQFADYEWVLQIDADMFMARPPGCEGVYPFFDFFINRTEALSHWACVHLHGPKRAGELQWPVQQPSGTRDAWYQLAGEMVNRNIDSGSMFTGLSAAITAFRAKHLFGNDHERLQWMSLAGRALQSDEGLFGLMDFAGIPIWGIMNQMRLSGVWGVQDLHRVREAGEFYLAHMGLPQEWDWRADIGVEDV